MVGRGVLVGHVLRTPEDTEGSGDMALGVSGTYAAGKVVVCSKEKNTGE